ncbi:MAG: hypothetical protein HXX15_23005 [Rhodopseudomonas sp.]|nr:hypothetical protein [Rhodopseudomonas sp.]
MLAAGQARAQAIWTDWRGSKFGTRIEYPSDLFAIQPEPDAQDGRTFAAADGAQIAAYGVFNDVVDFESAIAATTEGDAYSQVTYRRRHSGWAVVSGIRPIDGRPSVFYERYFLDPRKDVYHVVVMTYPTEAKATYDPIVRRIAGSLDSSRYTR